MIFVTLGSQKFQFNRLLKEIDDLVENNFITEEIFAQIGYSDYRPEHYEFKEFLNRDEFKKYSEKADLVITHGGTGAIIGALKQGKKVIAIPRLVEYGEHVDNHQLQLIKQFEESKLIYACNELGNLKDAIKSIEMMTFEIYKSNTKNILDSIEKFIGEDN